MVLNFSEDEIRVYTGRSTRRVVHSYGVELKVLIYNSDDLKHLRQEAERNPRHVNSADTVTDPDFEENGVYLKYDPLNLGSIWALDPVDRLYLKVPALLRDYAEGMTLRRHQLNLQYARQLVKDSVDEEALLRAHRELTEIINKASIHDAERLGKIFARGILPEPPKPVQDPAPAPVAPCPASSSETASARNPNPPQEVPTQTKSIIQLAEAPDDRLDELAALWTRR